MIRCIFLILTIAAMAITSSTSFAMPSTGTVEVFFSPNGGATEAVVREIGKASQEILVQANSFTSKPIAKALLDAYKQRRLLEVALEGDYRTPTCPQCDIKMVLRESKKGRGNGGQFWGCVRYPRCKQTLVYKPHRAS